MDALHGLSSYQIIKVSGSILGQKLTIFIDRGSTHNFLTFDMAKKLQCKFTKIAPIIIAVVDGYQISYYYICKNLKWRMHNIEF